MYMYSFSYITPVVNGSVGPIPLTPRTSSFFKLCLTPHSLSLQICTKNYCSLKDSCNRVLNGVQVTFFDRILSFVAVAVSTMDNKFGASLVNNWVFYSNVYRAVQRHALSLFVNVK